MEMEYKDQSRRGRYIIILGLVLAIAAGAAAFFLINSAQQNAGQGPLQKVSVVVAARAIPARNRRARASNAGCTHSVDAGIDDDRRPADRWLLRPDAGDVRRRPDRAARGRGTPTI